MRYTVEEALNLWKEAKEIRQPWESVWQECYDYGLPGKRGFTQTTTDTQAFDRLFDTTAVDALSEFVTTLQFGLTAPMAKSIELVPDVELEEGARYQVQLELDKLRDMVLQALDDANADVADPETFADCGCVGGGFQLLPEREGQWPPFEVMNVSATEVWLLPGPFGQPMGHARCNKAMYRDLVIEYPDANWGPIRQGQSAEALEKLELTVIEMCYRDFSDSRTMTCHYCLFVEKGPTELLKHTFVGEGSNPWVMARWTGASKDYYGRPPMLTALPLAKTLNLANEMVLENAEFAMTGMWQYEGGDTINANQIQLIPGTIIPKVPGTAGLEPLRTDHMRFDVSQMVGGAHAQQIRAAFFNMDLGPMDKTPMSAEEARIRKGKALQRMGASYLRLKREFVEMRARRVIYLLVKNKFFQLPQLPHDMIRVRVISPLQRQVSMEEVERVSGYIGAVAGLYGPKMALVLSNPAHVASQLAKSFQIPAGLVPSPEEVKQAMQQMLGGVAQQEQQAPGSGQAIVDAAAQFLPKG